jgi:hypothetical protein
MDSQPTRGHWPSRGLIPRSYPNPPLRSRPSGRARVRSPQPGHRTFNPAFQLRRTRESKQSSSTKLDDCEDPRRLIAMPSEILAIILEYLVPDELDPVTVKARDIPAAFRTHRIAGWDDLADHPRIFAVVPTSIRVSASPSRSRALRGHVTNLDSNPDSSE